MEKIIKAFASAAYWCKDWYTTTTKNKFYIPYAVGMIISFILGAIIL